MRCSFGNSGSDKPLPGIAQQQPKMFQQVLIEP